MRIAGALIAGVLAAAAAPSTERADYTAAMGVHQGNAVVLLVQDGCEPCRRLENDLIPILRQGGVMEDSSIHIVSVQRHPKLVRQLQGSALNSRRGFPVIVVFRQKLGGQWAWRTFGHSGHGALIKWLRDIKRWQPPVNKGRGIL